MEILPILLDALHVPPDSVRMSEKSVFLAFLVKCLHQEVDAHLAHPDLEILIESMPPMSVVLAQMAPVPSLEENVFVAEREKLPVVEASAKRVLLVLNLTPIRACVLNVHKDSFLRMANSASPVSKEQSQPVWGLSSVRLVPLDLLQTLEELHVSPAKLDFLPPLAGLVLPVKGVRRPEVEVLVNPVPLEMETRQLSQDPVYPVHWATAL